MKDLAQIMQQAQAMQAKMAEVQAKIEAAGGWSGGSWGSQRCRG